MRGEVASTLLTLLLVAATGYAAGYFYFTYRPDLQTDDTAAHQVVKAASDGTVALLSYSPETLDRDFANAKSRLTEDYLAYYQRFADQIVGPSAQRGQVTTTATVVKAAVSEMHPNSAVVLVFIRQKTASKEKPQPVVTSSSSGSADKGQRVMAYRKIRCRVSAECRFAPNQIAICGGGVSL